MVQYVSVSKPRSRLPCHHALEYWIALPGTDLAWYFHILDGSMEQRVGQDVFAEQICGNRFLMGQRILIDLHFLLFVCCFHFNQNRTIHSNVCVVAGHADCGW